MKGFIYKYTFLNGKVYIGQTRRSLQVRHREHLNEALGKMTPGFWEAYQQFGEPTLEIIETIEDDREMDLVDKLNKAETYYIDIYHATDPQHGYNKRAVGSVASNDMMKLNDEFRDVYEKASKPALSFIESVMDKVFHKTGPLTEEEKRFIRENVMDPEDPFYDEVKDYNLDDLSANSTDDDFWMGEIYQGFLAVFQATLFSDIDSYIYENSDEIIRRRSKGHIIQQLDMDGNVIREYGSNGEVVQALNIARVDNVLNVLKGRQKSAYGYRWRYKEE